MIKIAEAKRLVAILYAQLFHSRTVKKGTITY